MIQPFYMETLLNPSSAKDQNATGYGILVESIGSAGISLIPALKKVSPLSENKIAALLYQTPSLLMTGLEEAGAKEVNKLLISTGLETKVIRADESFEKGDSDHEVALVINEFKHIQDIAKEIPV